MNLGKKNENMCIFTHPNPYPTSPSPIVFGIPSTQNPPLSDLSQTTPLPSSLLICYTSSSDLRIVEIMETKFVVVWEVLGKQGYHHYSQSAHSIKYFFVYDLNPT
jgi:hypothetical protein